MCGRFQKEPYHAQVSHVDGKHEGGPVAVCPIDIEHLERRSNVCPMEPLAAAWCSLLSLDGRLEESGVWML